MIGVGALTVGLGLVTVLGSGAASAKGSPPTGTVTCTGVTGTTTFNPPLTNSGTSAENGKQKITFTSCTSSSGVTVTKGAATGTISQATNSCGGLAGGSGTGFTFEIKWAPGKVGKSVVSFSSETPSSDSSGDEGFSLSGGSVTGSFAGSETASGTAYTNQTATQLASECGSSGGLKTLTITSGSITI